MPVYSNRFKVEVLDGNAALSRQYAEIQTSVSAAEAAAEASAESAASAADAANDAAAVARVIMQSRQDIVISTDAYSTGSILFAAKEGYSFEVISEEGTPHFTTSGGVPLIVLPSADGSIPAGAFGVVADYVPGVSTGTDQSAALNAALAYAGSSGASEVVLECGFYRISATIDIPEGVSLNCRTSNALVNDGTYSSESQCVLVLVGTGPKVHSFSNDHMGGGFEMGGEINNPSAAQPYIATHGGRSAKYRLLDFTNGDATGTTLATAKLFSAGVIQRRKSGIRGIVVTHNHNGDFAGVIDAVSWGDDWDVGIWASNPDTATQSDVSAWGYFRMAALLFTNAQMGDGIIPQGERGVFSNCAYRGYRALAMRSPTGYTSTASTATTVEIAWSASHRWAASGTFATGSDNAVYTYTGLTRTGDKLTFTGVTPSASGVSAGTEIYFPGSNYGVAGTVFRDCYFRDITHTSGRYCVDAYFGAAAFPYQSAGIEISGRATRQPIFENCIVHCREDAALFWHDARDVVWSGGFIESRPSVDQSGAALPRGTRAIMVREGSSILSAPYVTKGARSLVFSVDTKTSDTMWLPAFNVRGAAVSKFGASGGMCDPLTTMFGPTALGAYNASAQGDTNAPIYQGRPRIMSTNAGGGGYDGPLASFRADATDGADLPVGSIIPVYMGASSNLENRRASRSIRQHTDGKQYTIFGAGAILTGTWRCLGITGADGTNYYQLFQRMPD